VRRPGGGWWRRVSGPAGVVGLAAIGPLLAPGGAAAQLWGTDDAGVVERGACQLESWHREAASWLAPACRLVGDLEVALELGLVDDNGDRGTEYVLEGKMPIREPEPNGLGVAIALGMTAGRPGRLLTGRAQEVYAFVPVSLSIGDDRLVLHGNAGWQVEREPGEEDGETGDRWRHGVKWGGRADLEVIDRLQLVGELFGEDRLRPEYHLGLRGTVVPDRFVAELAYGGDSAPGARGRGWTLGLAWTPPPFAP
jgi:hypothetical protein